MSADLVGLPAQPFDAWLRRELPDVIGDGSWSAEVISGGLSNITYRLDVGGRRLILRRPPVGEILPSAHDVVREYRVMSALVGTEVPVPATLALCTDATVLGQPFYLMDAVEGVVLRSAQDTALLRPADRASATESFVSALATLHGQDVEAVGLGNYGRPEGYCERQIRRWGEQWRRSQTRSLPDMDRLLQRLAESIPAQQRSSIVHGDYRLDNTITDPANDYRVAAILDWELSTLGDPMADLGMAMTYWHDQDDEERALIPVAAGITAYDGFPTRAELAQTYAAKTGADLSELRFYLAFGGMKLAIILEGVHSRFLGGKSVGDGYDRAGEAVPILVARALREFSGSAA
jgi:aminoglycoside phosphotransferase (APT) family kinase protein